MRARDVTGAVGTHRYERRILEAGGDVDQPVREDRPRHVREAVGISRVPISRPVSGS